MPDKAHTTPTGETRYRHITSSQRRLMAKQRWDATVKRQKAETKLGLRTCALCQSSKSVSSYTIAGLRYWLCTKCVLSGKFRKPNALLGKERKDRRRFEYAAT